MDNRGFRNCKPFIMIHPPEKKSRGVTWKTSCIGVWGLNCRKSLHFRGGVVHSAQNLSEGKVLGMVYWDFSILEIFPPHFTEKYSRQCVYVANKGTFCPETSGYCANRELACNFRFLELIRHYVQDVPLITLLRKSSSKNNPFSGID